MVRVSGQTRLKCAQGDTSSLRLRVKLGGDKVKNIQFICDELGLIGDFVEDNHELTNVVIDKGYLYKIPGEMTAKIPPCITDYSIRVTFIDGTVKTILYRQSLTILKMGGDNG